MSDDVQSQDVYAAKGIRGRLRNDADMIYRQSGNQLTLDVQPQGGGYASTFKIGIALDGA